MSDTLTPGDVVLLDDSDPVFGGCLMVVDEVKTWGVQGFVTVPAPVHSGRAYYRVKYDHCVKIGRLP